MKFESAWSSNGGFSRNTLNSMAGGRLKTVSFVKAKEYIPKYEEWKAANIDFKYLTEK